MSELPDRYVVVGNPIAHSRSPLIHQTFAKQTRENLEYKILEAPLDNFTESIRHFRAGGGKGCNVTIPFKESAWSLAQEHSFYAERAGAVNTLLFREDDTIFGANTDGLGLIQDLQVNNHLSLQGSRILLLGAGGAVRGVIEPLFAEQAQEIFIANRTAAKAEKLAQLFSGSGSVSGGGYEDISGKFDLVINGTAASLHGVLPPIPSNCLTEQACCYDMMYSAQPTTFMTWSQEQGATMVLDGLGMLVEQAAESFAIWRGVRPETQSVLVRLRQLLLDETG